MDGDWDSGPYEFTLDVAPERVFNLKEYLPAKRGTYDPSSFDHAGLDDADVTSPQRAQRVSPASTWHLGDVSLLGGDTEAVVSTLARQQGFVPLREAGLALAARGARTDQEVLRATRAMI